MKIILEYDKKANLLYATASGEFDLNTYKEAMEKIVNSSSYPPDVSTIWNVSDLDFELVDVHHEKQVAEALKLYPQRKGAWVAYVVDSQLGYGMMRMLEGLIGNNELCQKVFYNSAEAEKWLKSRG